MILELVEYSDPQVRKHVIFLFQHQKNPTKSHAMQIAHSP